MKQITYERPSHVKSMGYQWCDVIIQVDEQRFRAHKTVLAANIPYFQGTFVSDFQENNMEVVWVNNITASNMDIIIAFAYTGKITLTEDNVHGLIVDVDYLQLTDIKQECEKFLLLILRVENVCKTYQIADALSCSSLKEESYKFMCQNIRNVVQTKDFLDIGFNLLTDVVIANDLRYAIFSPSELFEIIMQWLTNKFNERKIHLPELIRCVKFSASAIKNIHNYIRKDEVVAKLSERELKDLVADILHQISEKQGVKNDQVDKRCFNQAKGRIVVVKELEPCSIEIYDPSTGAWESIPIYEPCYTYSGAVHEGRLYLVTDEFGIFYEFKSKRWGEIPLVNLDSVERFVAGSGDYLYLCQVDFTVHQKFIGKFARFCSRTGHWENLTSMNIVRLDGAIVTFQRHVYVIGGITGYKESKSSNIVERYDPETDEWTFIPEMQNYRRSAAAAVLNEKIYVCGGFSETSDFNSVEFYDPKTNRWQYAAPMNEARRIFVVVALAGKLLAIGGVDDGRNPLSSIEVYDPDKNTWSLISSGEMNLGYVFGGVLFNEC